MMKKLSILILLLLFTFQAPICAYEEDFFDTDMEFLDNPFKDQKIITDKEFNDTIEKMKGKKKEPSKFTKWLFGVKDDKKAPPKNIDENEARKQASEIEMLQDTMKANNLILISTAIQDDFGHVINSGHYKAKYRKGNDDKVYITLSQAGKTKGCFHAIKTEDKSTKNAIIYARTNFNSASGAIEIYVSDFDNTYYTKAKVLY
ncbi:hypothetical protein IJC60_00525 [bacterium]|nr:hypothetical protein [bacterium]